MDSAENTRFNAQFTQRFSITKEVPLDSLRNADTVLVPKLQRAYAQNSEVGCTVSLSEEELGEASLIAVGGYNTVWLVQPDQNVKMTDGTIFNKFIIRLSCDDALFPNQVLNEVAFRQLVANKLPHIPVPQVYAYQSTNNSAFTIEEFIDGATLSSTWTSFTSEQKNSVAHELARILVDLSEVQFDVIGGLDPSSLASAPTVEGCKLFKGRNKFHDGTCYSIGPYKSTKEYILAYYDKEIYYYSHASKDDIDMDLFEETPINVFLDELKKKREHLAAADIPDEPFTLVHGDFHGRNIMMKGDKIVAILDWEFAGSYPLSETLTGGGVDVLEADTEELEEENDDWSNKIRSYILDEAERRAWSKDKIASLMGDGNLEVAKVRVEMFPLE